MANDLSLVVLVTRMPCTAGERRHDAFLRPNEREGEAKTSGGTDRGGAVTVSFAVPGRVVFTGDGGGDAAARREGSDDATSLRGADGDEIVEQAVDDGLVEGADVAEALKVQLQRLQLHAGLAGHVAERDGAEVRLAGLGAQAGELRTDDFDGVIAPRMGVGKGFQLFGLGNFKERHGCNLGWWKDSEPESSATVLRLFRR